MNKTKTLYKTIQYECCYCGKKKSKEFSRYYTVDAPEYAPQKTKEFNEKEIEREIKGFLLYPVCEECMRYESSDKREIITRIQDGENPKTVYEEIEQRNAIDYRVWDNEEFIWLNDNQPFENLDELKNFLGCNKNYKDNFHIYMRVREEDI